MRPTTSPTTPRAQPAAKSITVVSTTRNCLGVIEGYVESMLALDPAQIDWIVIDAGSTDGTREVLERHAGRFAWFVSEPDDGTYHGLNKAVARVATPYYVVFGADDRPSASFLASALPLLADRPALVLGATRLVPSGRVKGPGKRWMHPWSWGRVVSHHSVGTLIRTNLHQSFGFYDTRYQVVADGAFLLSVLRSRQEKIATSNAVFGDYAETGISARRGLFAIFETFLVQCDKGSALPFQFMLLNLRLLKAMRARRATASR